MLVTISSVTTVHAHLIRPPVILLELLMMKLHGHLLVIHIHHLVIDVRLIALISLLLRLFFL